MPKPKQFFYKIDASHLLQQVLRIDGAKARGEWITAVALQLVTHDGENEFAAELIQEAEKFSQKRAVAGALGNEVRWQNDRNAIAKVSPTTTTPAIAIAPQRERKSANAFVPPTLEEATAYFKESGQVDPQGFIDYYASNDWRDSRNNPVKNWKQKSLLCWKPNHKAIVPQPVKKEEDWV
jgi:hypothetical protein